LQGICSFLSDPDHSLPASAAPALPNQKVQALSLAIQLSKPFKFDHQTVLMSGFILFKI
jgi:hypothetical protein